VLQRAVYNAKLKRQSRIIQQRWIEGVRGDSLEFLCDRGDLLDAILMSREIRLEGLVLLLQGLELVQLALPEVLGREHLFLAGGPILMRIRLMFELLRQMFQSFQTHHL